MSKISKYSKYAKVIKLDEATYDRLATVGRFKETYAGIINRLIDLYEKQQEKSSFSDEFKNKTKRKKEKGDSE